MHQYLGSIQVAFRFAVENLATNIAGEAMKKSFKRWVDVSITDFDSYYNIPYRGYLWGEHPVAQIIPVQANAPAGAKKHETTTSLKIPTFMSKIEFSSSFHPHHAILCLIIFLH